VKMHELHSFCIQQQFCSFFVCLLHQILNSRKATTIQ
jgi:hypothetical protein